MGSRRTTPHSSLGNGRSSSGEDNGNSRPGSCSYLSNVRPENRSTLCSVIAQLTEETQPFFETTVRSKAVCENSNVKFSCVVTGYPTPLVIWYKEDMQLDRYCGLPKYEIFHDGQNHSLHIYNCTVEDAAIYQVSASNSKGIVSCAGVLEVGEMNELKIHEHYFAKIRQKAVLMRKEVEGKENQEPLRTISPERPQRKRRSTMEAYLNMPSSMGEEESQQAVVVETESRLQEATVGEAEEKSTPVTNGEALNDHGNKAGTFIYDSAQRLFTTLQPKIPFVKKKIKISSRPKIAKSDPLKEKASEERGTKQKAAGTKSQQSKGSSEEVMEVDNSVSSSVVDLYIRNVAEQHQKSATEEAMLMKRPSQDEDKCVVPQRKQLTASVSPAALTGTGQTVPGPKGKQAAKHEKKAGPKNAEESLGIQSQRPNMNPVQRQPSALPSLLKRHVTKTEDATVMDVDKKSNTSTGGSLGGSDLECMETTYESRTASTQRPSEQAEPQLSQKEPSQRLVSVPRPALHSKAHTKKNRNDAAVNLGLPPDQRAMDMQPPRKTPAERETTADDNKTLSLHNDLQAPIDKMTQNAWDHSSGSNESHTVPYTDLQKSSVESPGGENIRGCNVSPTTVQSQVDTVGESVEEMNVDENTEREEVDKLLDDSVAPDEKILELETENAALHMGGQNITEKARDAVDQGADFITAEASCKDTNELIISSELQNQKTDTLQTAMPHLTNNLENTNSLEQIRGFKEIPNTASKVISSAEQLRSQVKALDSMLPNSVHIDFVQEPSQTTREACQDLRGDERKYKLEMKQSNVETATDHTPPSNIKSVLQPHAAASPHVQAVIPPISVTDTGITVETAGVHGSTKKDHDGFTDIVVSVTESESVKHQFQPLTSKDTLTDILGSGTPTNASSQELGIALEHAKDGPLPEKIMELIRSLIPEIKLNSETEGAITEMLFSDQCKMEKHNTNTGSLSVEKFPTKSVFSTDTQESILQLDSSVAEEYATNNSLTNSTPEASPLLKKRDCVSPIPSATPQELASGARRKILMPRDDPEEATGATEATSAVDSQTQKLSTSPVTLPMSPGPSRRSPLLQPAGEQTPPVERRSPMSRRKAALEAPAPGQQPTEESHTQKDEGKPTERDKHDPFKAPQVIRKIRGETFTDVSGHMKL
uniref:non-specific serine/threonine protein kinase n=2 Tax=Monopterus albus TaxID=43700 RepID=A0A3Q3J863_MONAL